ncbi:hypothetical protein [Tautonia sociabilis]|uniref:Uncharacterized protein n=1 Tax=Tautonia sociabilis TaxID=2080755 RepID=A0A432MRB7_9BACT|nr:hypothetical protein [Tautonia sociabilis]RUL89478.1 hypothetical protein TsocGM_01515 [Tautonia sociabilis]
MLRYISHLLVVFSLLASPVFAQCSDVPLPSDSSAAAVKVDQGRSNDGENKIATDHHCCTSHAHYGEPVGAYAHPFAPATGNERLPLIADRFLAAFEPNPLLEPPAGS